MWEIRSVEPNLRKISAVVYLHVPIDYVFRVEIGEGGDDFGAVEARPTLAEDLFPLQMEEQLSSVRELHDKTELLPCLEAVLKPLEQTKQASTESGPRQTNQNDITLPSYTTAR